MALTDENMVMPVSPMYGGGNGFGNGFGGDWGWIILLLLCAGGGWGNGFGGFGGGFNNALGYDFPWLLNGQQAINNNTNEGFYNLSTQNHLTAIQSDLGDIQTQLCGGFADVNSAICNGFAQAEISDNARQIANMQQAFNSQVAVTGAINDVQAQLAQCCCDNRLATCQTQNIVQNEGNATRFADATNTRDIIENANRNNQAILDKLCALEIDAKNDRISELERQLTMADLRASQTAQNAFISQGFTNEVDALYNRLSSCPVPTTPVYGRTPIFTCNNNGCGCGGNF